MFAVAFAAVAFLKTCFPNRQKRKGSKAINLVFSFPPQPYGSRIVEMIHINYGFPAVFLLTFLAARASCAARKV